MTASTTATRSVALPHASLLIGGTYAICVLAVLGVFVGNIVFTDEDPHRNDGPIESILTIGIAGTAALVVALVVGMALASSPSRAKVGAVVFGALAIVTSPFFWSGVPGVFGAAAAWLGGLTKGSRPIGGAARVMGLLGALVAVLNIVLSVGGILVQDL